MTKNNKKDLEYQKYLEELMINGSLKVSPSEKKLIFKTLQKSPHT